MGSITFIATKADNIAARGECHALVLGCSCCLCTVGVRVLQSLAGCQPLAGAALRGPATATTSHLALLQHCPLIPFVTHHAEAIEGLGVEEICARTDTPLQEFLQVRGMPLRCL